MSKKDRIFFMAWGAVVFPLIIIGCTVSFNWNSAIIIPSLLTFMGGIKWLLQRDSDCPDNKI